MFNRPLFLAVAGFAFSLTVLAAPAAQAFTFEDQGAGTGTSAKNNDTSMFYNSGKSDPLSSRLDSSGQTTVMKRDNATVYFGGSGQSFDQRNDPNSYFNPNVLMGK